MTSDRKIPRLSDPSRRVERSPRGAPGLAARRVASKPVREFLLPLERIQPVIRIAHQRSGVLNIKPRLIVDHELLLMLRGAASLEVDGTSVPLQAGVMVLIPPFVEHSFRATDVSDHAAIHFDLSPAVPGTRAAARSSAYRVRLSQGQSLPTCRPIPTGTLVREQVERAVEAFAERSAAGVTECSCLVAAVMCRALGAGETVRLSPHEARLQRLADHIDAHAGEPLDASTLAEICGLSPSRLRTVFRQYMGVSPHRFILQRRIALARRLLADDDLTLRQVAHRCGFADEFHFSKVFRKLDGLPPSLYRQQAQTSRF